MPQDCGSAKPHLCGLLIVRQHVKRIVSSWMAALLWFSTANSQNAPTRETGDYNFDGHLDYRVPAESPGNQCGWWKYFIFDASVREHRAVETAFCKEEFDAAERLVKTRVNGGMAGYIFTIR